MALQESYEDAFGNLYRIQGDEWQVMRPGVGWGPFTCSGNIKLTSGEVIPASAKQHNEPKWSEAEKSLIIAQARDIHLQMVAVESNAKSDASADWLAETAVADAQALVEALKREGVL